MAEQRLLRRGAAEPRAESAGPFRGVGRPHLQKTIRETGFKDAAGDGLERHLITKINSLPDLFPAALKRPKRLGILRAVTRAALRAKRLQKPGVHFARREALHFEAHRDFLTVDQSVRVQQGVVPGITDSHPALAA